MLTLEEMASELRKAGWTVKEPFVCDHPPHARRGMIGTVSSDGSSSGSEYCVICAQSWKYKTPQMIPGGTSIIFCT